MRDYDDDSTPEPAALWLELQRQRAAAANFVAPAAPLARRDQTIDVVPWAMQTTALDVGRAWEPLQGTKESTSAVDRARGLRIRLLPFLGLYGLAGVVVGGVVWYVAGIVPVAALLAVLTFAGLGISTYRRMNLDDYDHSTSGVERLRISEAAQLQREQLEQTHELRRMALESYLKRLERD